MRHKLSHTERRFACKVCNKQFTEKNLVNTHMQRMHQMKTVEQSVKEGHIKCKEENEPLQYVKEEEITMEDRVMDEQIFVMKHEIVEGRLYLI